MYGTKMFWTCSSESINKEKGEMKLKEIYWIWGASFFFANCSLSWHEKGIDFLLI